MSNFEVLQYKLKRLRGFYETTTQPFHEIMRKIDAHETPYVVEYDGNEPDGDPPFEADWTLATEDLNLQEQLCLNILQRTLREFLVSTIRAHPGYPQTKPDECGNWFENYQKWFRAELALIGLRLA